MLESLACLYINDMAAFDRIKLLFKENTYLALTSSANAPLLFAIVF